MSDNKVNKKEYTAGDSFFGQMREAGIADDNFVREIVQMFLEEGQMSLNELRDAFENKKPNDFKILAHKLKSSFLMFDMLDAHALAVRLETSPNEQLEACRADLVELEINCAKNFELLKLKYFK